MLSANDQAYFWECAKDILASEDVQRMKTFIQHGNVSCYEHSLCVAYGSFCLCRRLHLRVDTRSLIRGALLHDFFLYDWHTNGMKNGLHGFTHPKTALRNAQKQFCLNKKEQDIIVKHMWPLTVIPPRCKEGYIVCLLDKYCSVRETFRCAKLVRA